MLAEKPDNDHTLAGGRNFDFRLCATLAASHTGDFLCKPTRTQGRIRTQSDTTIGPRAGGSAQRVAPPGSFHLTCGG
jgi:hypothetical protein